MKRRYTAAFDATLARCQPGRARLLPARRPVRLRAVLLALGLLYLAGWAAWGLLAWALNALLS